MTTTQTHAALLSDEEIVSIWSKHSILRTYSVYSIREHVLRAMRDVEQALLAKLQPAQSIPPGLRVGDSHMESLIEAAIQGHAGTRDAMRWLVRQIARVEDKPAQEGELPEPELGYIKTDKSNQPAYSARQMRAALAARKPLTDEQIESLLVNWPKDGIAFIDFARAVERAHGINGLEVKP